MIHRNTKTHWVPPENVKDPVAAHAETACGKDIDGPCEIHLAEGTSCQYGLAWTRSRDLASYQHRPYESWPPPCSACAEAVQRAETPRRVDTGGQP
jgi:hypothetical protein